MRNLPTISKGSLRDIANSPRSAQIAAYKAIREVEGKQAADAWAVRLKAEIERLKGLICQQQQRGNGIN